MWDSHHWPHTITLRTSANQEKYDIRFNRTTNSPLMLSTCSFEAYHHDQSSEALQYHSQQWLSDNKLPPLQRWSNKRRVEYELCSIKRLGVYSTDLLCRTSVEADNVCWSKYIHRFRRDGSVSDMPKQFTSEPVWRLKRYFFGSGSSSDFTFQVDDQAIPALVSSQPTGKGLLAKAEGLSYGQHTVYLNLIQSNQVSFYEAVITIGVGQGSK